MKLNISKKTSDIDRIMEVVETFGGSPDDLVAIKSYVLKEAQEFGGNRVFFFYLGDDGKACAIAQLILNNADGRSDLANGTSIAHIHGLQVSKSMHRQGIGIQMMRDVEDYARKNSISRLTLGVDGDNQKAQSLYEKLSYSLLEKVEGRSPDVPLFYMYKDL